ncbi:ABC transporter permease [Mycobacterium sp. Y57]|uniref:ABC transporter permease n=1 Tax=Mycolicibacterium xanthum TaxID=2796469 RepID=UPI001C85745C|nr:ABC transporter permease [Mycolicibacterium xanthum]MBX7433992.1 ABC transporter permease [Mycolicibacterium xanthum]
MRAAVSAEAIKLYRAPVGRAGSALLGLGIPVLCCAMSMAARSSDPQVLAKLGPAAEHTWAGLLAGAAQITGAGGLLGFGVVLSWMFGREFVDGTITGLFALPVSRRSIAAAKLLVFLMWSVVVSAVIVVALVAGGLTLGLGFPPAAALAGLARQFVLGVLTAVVATPVAWAATVGRSLLVGIVCAIGLVIAAQVAVIAGAGGWFSVAAPALWAMSGGDGVSVAQLALLVPLLGAAASLTLVSWARLQLTR